MAQSSNAKKNLKLLWFLIWFLSKSLNFEFLGGWRKVARIPRVKQIRPRRMYIICSRAIFRVDIGNYIATVVWGLLKYDKKLT